MPKATYKIISVGGSIVIPKGGFDISFLKKFRQLIVNEVKRGSRFILVIGGGGTARQYQNAAKGVMKMSDEELDWVGIHTTILNAQFVRILFKEYAYKDVVVNPTKKIRTQKSIIVAAGWKPGCSTDKDAVLLAKTYGVKEMINLSNIAYVYDKDPNKHKNAKKIEHMDWGSLRELVGNSWDPGLSAPFDPIAAKEAEKLGLTVSILDGTNLKEVGKSIRGEKFQGTIIT
jgi:uridylate kinase